MVLRYVETFNPATQRYEGRMMDTNSRFDRERLRGDIGESEGRGRHGPLGPYIDGKVYDDPEEGSMP